MKLIDVTLRDGGYRTNFDFDNNTVETVISLLDEAGIEYIEVGYRKGPLKPYTTMGRTAKSEKDYLLLCKSFMKNAKMTVILHPHNVEETDIHEMIDCGVDLIRVCLPKDNLENSLNFINFIKQYDVELAVNITRISRYSKEALDERIRILQGSPVDIIYLADSNGSMLPGSIRDIFKSYTRQYTKKFGFHAHDNLGLAQSNAIAALECGAKMIDASLTGLGKGLGNLKTLFYSAYLQVINQSSHYKLEKILQASNHIQGLSLSGARVQFDHIRMGMFDLTIDEVKNTKELSL